MTILDSPTICIDLKIEPPPGIPARYEVLSQIGSGGMGVVYKVHDLETDEVIALKILRSDVASDPTMKENLKREVCLARRVTHKNVCRIHEFNRSNSTVYISMEFVEGESLQSALQTSGPLAWNEALKIIRQICAGLGEAHAQGIVHRDLKPANIMMDRSGVVKIMDFGIARPFQGTGQMTGTLIGTPAYMAPEQVEMKRVDARTDVYALGLLLYEIVTGSPAFEGETPIAVALKQLHEVPELSREIAATLPAHAQAVIRKCLQKDPDKRFRSTDELAAALRNHVYTKPAVSPWKSYVVDLKRSLADLQRSGLELRRDLQPRIEAIGQSLRQQKFVTNKRNQKALALGLGAVSLVSGVVLLAGRNTKTNQPVNSASLAPLTSGQSSLSSVPPSVETDNQSAQRPPLAGAALSINRYEVDLSTGSGLVSKDISSANLETTQLTSKEARTSRTEKARPAVRRPPASKAHTTKTTLPVAIQSDPQSPLAIDSPSSVAQAEISNELKSEEIGSDLSASSVPAIPSATNLATAKEAITTDGSQAPTDHFLEVGSFKDTTWADHAVEKLTQLGFQAVSVRRKVLWVRSYQVRVGPFSDLKALDEARLNLISQGFKPHPVK